MRHSIKLGMLALLASTALMTTRADAASAPNSNGIRAAIDGLSVIDSVQGYYVDGRQYCWYDDAWQGPGWYWCGYAWRSGYFIFSSMSSRSFGLNTNSFPQMRASRTSSTSATVDSMELTHSLPTAWFGTISRKPSSRSAAVIHR